MPYGDESKYTGLDYYWRVFGSFSTIVGITAGLTYPLDLIHTRLVTDMSKKGTQRLFTTTFDCFNRTNIDEGFRAGLYKGYDVAMAGAVIRAGMTLPLYDVVRSDKVQAVMNSNGMLSNFNAKIGVSLLSSLIMSFLIYPLDTAKRCMQLNGAKGHYNLYKGSVDCIQKIVAQGGV